MIKEHIVKALKWALSKFEDKPAEVWDFPVPAKKRPQVKKATTKTVAKKATKVVKKAK
jgi:hypothetical protein